MLLSRGLDDFGKDAAGRCRVQERDPRAADPDPRLLVDQAQAGGRARVERFLDGRDSVGDVVESRSALAQELADHGLRIERRQQLDVAVADIEQGRVDALLGDSLPVYELHTERVPVERQRRVDVRHGDADVVDR